MEATTQYTSSRGLLRLVLLEPATLVTEIAMSASECFHLPSTIARAISFETAP
ncbi:hypothetical protein GGR08_001137 [Bartonella fuyuanensis]|uniref:Uncharacterized protein n=1 Tax=Bartonella fuyuanensis TaxID=1460968 RepID=A0A840E1H6_9HYPH|nr:hypothetical protein [Bartonella fuyuanensis]